MTLSRSSIRAALTAVAVVFAGAGTATPARAGFTVGFDDLPSYSPIPAGYNGFNWTNFGALDVSPYVGYPGYGQAMVSPNNIAFSESDAESDISTPGSTPFTFVSGTFASGFNDGLTIKVSGLNAGAELYTTTLVLNTTGPTSATFNYAGIDQVRFGVTAPGTPASGLPYSGFGAQFGMDDLVFSDSSLHASPAPPGLVLALSGATCLGAFGWLRRRKFAAVA